MEDFLRRYKKDIIGVISCYDRILIRGTLTSCCYVHGMETLLYSKGVKIFDYPQYAQQFKENIRRNAENIAKENGITIEFVSKKNIRKEDIVKKVLKARGNQSGLVHIISAMETCNAYRPRYDKTNNIASLAPTKGKCLHYYFYFIDEEFGLCHMRVPTWCPFTLQFYCNGHNYLANKLEKKKIGFKMIDNAFSMINNFTVAQELSDDLEAKPLHKILDKWSHYLCPAIKELPSKVHWSLRVSSWE